MPIGKKKLAGKYSERYVFGSRIGREKDQSFVHVAGATCLYEARVPEKVIQQRTGHRCLQSLRHYEKISSNLEVAVSKIFSGEVDYYKPESENKPDPFHSISKQESSLTAPFPGIGYNNCTVNVFGAGNVTPYPPSG